MGKRADLQRVLRKLSSVSGQPNRFHASAIGPCRFVPLAYNVAQLSIMGNPCISGEVNEQHKMKGQVVVREAAAQ